MFEHRRQKILSRPLFLKRMAISCLIATGIVITALGLGILGYHYVCSLDWLDALLNASMILTGMGPVNPMTSPAAKIFASLYALFSGIVFLSSIGIVISPLFHRIMHQLHVEDVE